MRISIALLIALLSVSCVTAPVSTPDPAPIAKPSIDVRKAILDIAGSSECLNYNFKDRGKPYSGYIKGMSIAYARSLCRYMSPLNTIAGVMGIPVGTAGSKDALQWYGVNAKDGQARMKLTYQLGIGLGMRESNGRWCTGKDASASNDAAPECEAGPFQSSYNSMGAHPKLKEVYAEYSKDGAYSDRCELSLWKENVKRCDSKSPNLGTGPGVAFQDLSKVCPMFAAEYNMALIRNLRNHFGPLTRKEAEIVPACGSLLDQVEKLVIDNPEACGSL